MKVLSLSRSSACSLFSTRVAMRSVEPAGVSRRRLGAGPMSALRLKPRVEQLGRVDAAVVDDTDRRAAVDPRQPLAEGLEVGVVHQVALAHQDAIGEPDLGLGDGLGQVALGVDGVHQGDDAVQHVALAEFLVGEEGLRHWRRSARPVHSITRRSKASSPASRRSSNRNRAFSSSTWMEQQTQPLARVITCTGSSPSSWPSMGVSLNSFSITAIFRPCSALRMCLSRVVLPAPKAAEHGDGDGEVCGHQGIPRYGGDPSGKWVMGISAVR